MNSKSCVVCDVIFVPSHSKVKCCGRDCTKKYRKLYCPTSKETREKISASLKLHFEEKGTQTKGESHSAAVGAGTRGKYNKDPQSILDLSSRTIRKVLKRLDIGCVRCGWKETICDIHHIKGRKGENPNNHDNLAYLCPNCHRLFHAKKFSSEEIINFKEQVGDSWKNKYFG